MGGGHPILSPEPMPLAPGPEGARDLAAVGSRNSHAAWERHRAAHPRGKADWPGGPLAIIPTEHHPLSPALSLHPEPRVGLCLSRRWGHTPPAEMHLLVLADDTFLAWRRSF